MSEAETKVPVTEGTTAAPEVAGEGKGGERPSPYRDWWTFDSLRRDVERAFEEFQRGPWRLPFTRTAFDIAPVWPGEFIWKANPPVEIVEKDEGYVITAEMPGVAAADVEVTLSDDRLTIAGEKKEEKEEHRRDVHLSERRYGAFQRTFRMPEEVDREKIAAQFRNGILTVTLPKTAEAQQNKRKIEVQAA